MIDQIKQAIREVGVDIKEFSDEKQLKSHIGGYPSEIAKNIYRGFVVGGETPTMAAWIPSQNDVLFNTLWRKSEQFTARILLHELGHILTRDSFIKPKGSIWWETRYFPALEDWEVTVDEFSHRVLRSLVGDLEEEVRQMYEDYPSLFPLGTVQDGVIVSAIMQWGNLNAVS